MISVSKKSLSQQWQTLHNSHENYEQYALIIKLVAVAMTLFSFMFSPPVMATILLLAALWLQEGIWKTFQSRTETAIMAIEEQISTGTEQDDEQLYLLYKAWQANRPKTKALIAEYINNSLKPTVIYPYVPLMLVILIF